MTLRIGIDIGGTFTDLVAITADGRVTTLKTASTPRDYGEGIIDGIRTLLTRDPGLVTEVLHATTVGSNTVLEATGARTALITTRGFRDILEIRDLRMPVLFDLQLDQTARIGGTTPAAGGDGKGAAGWLGVDSVGCRQRRHRDRASARRQGRKCRDLPVAQLRQSGTRTGGRRGGTESAAGYRDFREQRYSAGDQGISRAPAQRLSMPTCSPSCALTSPRWTPGCALWASMRHCN